MSDAGAPPVVRIRWLDAAEPLSPIEWRSADEWQILLEHEGTAVASVRVPYPGEGAGEGFLTATLLRHADERRALEAFVRDFRARLGAAERGYRPRSCSVVVCTHRRPDLLAGALDGLARLDPAPMEVIVVDNDPGDSDCREQAERAGARYVREDRRGLNAARAAGARCARGELVAYLDDDCVPPPHWLRHLPELFEDEMVAAVTGPAFAYELTTPAQRRRDEVAGFVQGLARVTYDWTCLRPVHSGRVGAGANMIFRREVLAELDDVFSPELDAGTSTQSGGDLYAFYRVLAAGYRITYDPGTYVCHRHRPDGAALTATVCSYGVGFASFLTKALVERHEFAAFPIWRWLAHQYFVALMARATGRGDAITLRLRWQYLASSLGGPGAWRTALREARAQGPLEPISPTTPVTPAAPAEPSRGPRATVSVIVTGADESSVARCCAALRACGEECEVIAVPGRDRPARRSAGAAAASGDVLVFLDGEVVPEPGLVERYVQRLASEDEPLVVLGYSPSRPGASLVAMHDAFGWADHFNAKRDAVTFTFADFVGSNIAMRRTTYERVGEFDPSFEAREDWDWGARALLAGVRAEFDAEAVAQRVPRPGSVLERIARAHAEGRDEVRLQERYGIALPPAPETRPLVRPFALALDQGGALPAAVLLDVLERIHARRTWLVLFRVALGAARQRGWRQAGGVGRAGSQMPQIDVDLGDPDHIPVPQLAPPALGLSRAGETVGRLLPRRAQWHGGLAREASRLLASVWWKQRGPRWWTALPNVGEDDPGPAAEQRAAPDAPLLMADDQPDHWRAFDAAVRGAEGAPFAALVLPGASASPSWTRTVAPAFEASRVAAVVGAGLHDHEPATPLLIHSRATLPARYASNLGLPFQYVAVNPQIHAALGGFRLECTAYGDHAPILDFIDRALAAGYVIGYRDTPGLTPAGVYRPARTRNEWSRWVAVGALLTRAARDEGVHGWLRLAGRFADGIWLRLVAGGARRWWLGSRLAFLYGVRKALRD